MATHELTIVKDAYVINESGNANNNFGSASLLTAATTSRYSYVWIDLSSLVGKTIISASYTIYPGTNTGAAGLNFTMSAFRAAGPWEEMGITYNNQPGITGAALGTVVIPGASTASRTLVFTNLAEFATMIANNLGFRISLAGSCILTWRSRNASSYKAVFTVTYEDGESEPSSGPTVAEHIQLVLDAQQEANWVLGECDYTDRFEFEFERTNLLSCLYSLVQRLSEDYYWSFNTQSFPWTINLKKVYAAPVTDVRYKKNVFGITKNTDPRSLCTRLYLYGKDELNISSLNDGKHYLDSPIGIATYGIIVLIIEDTRFEVAQHLYDYGVALLSKLDKPFITYTATIRTIYNAANLKIGDSVRIITEDGLDEILIVQEITKNDLSKTPNSGTVVIGQGTVELGLILKSFI